MIRVSIRIISSQLAKRGHTCALLGTAYVLASIVRGITIWEAVFIRQL